MSVSQLVNQNSYLIAAFVVFVIALVIVLARFRESVRAWLALLALIAILIAGNLSLSSGASEIETTAQFETLVAAHQPIVIEFYSNY
ncbi:hypothetical protein ANRL1_02062 [Anaerolineae bacterium]|nr:hypothetical protein ANRL1_02062 [Anaerolineae bacterium]